MASLSQSSKASRSYLAAWGRGISGQLALIEDDESDHILRPQPAQQMHPHPALHCNELVAKIGAGENYTALVTLKGDVLMCGSNASGELAVTNVGPLGTCKLVASLRGKDVIRIACGASHILAMSMDGRAFVWGLNSSGQLGLGHQRSCTSPMELHRPRLAATEPQQPVEAAQQPPTQQLRWVDASAGAAHTLALAATESDLLCPVLYSWGEGSAGCLGLGHSSNRSAPGLVPDFESTSSIMHIACGSRHSLLLTRDHSVYAFGLTADGRLGLPRMKASRKPIHDEDANAASGSLGPNEFRCCNPRCVSGFGGAKITMVAAGGRHSAALSADGDLFSWGDGRSHQLGDTKKHSRATPGRVPACSGFSVVWIGCGDRFTVARCADGKVICFGDNSEGQCAQGAARDSSAFGLVSGLHRASLLASGAAHVVAVVQPPSRVSVELGNSSEAGATGERCCNDATMTAAQRERPTTIARPPEVGLGEPVPAEPSKIEAASEGDDTLTRRPPSASRNRSVSFIESDMLATPTSTGQGKQPKASRQVPMSKRRESHLQHLLGDIFDRDNAHAGVRADLELDHRRREWQHKLDLEEDRAIATAQFELQQRERQKELPPARRPPKKSQSMPVLGGVEGATDLVSARQELLGFQSWHDVPESAPAAEVPDDRASSREGRPELPTLPLSVSSSVPAIPIIRRATARSKVVAPRLLQETFAYRAHFGAVRARIDAHGHDAERSRSSNATLSVPRLTALVVRDMQQAESLASDASLRDDAIAGPHGNERPLRLNALRLLSMSKAETEAKRGRDRFHYMTPKNRRSY